MGGKQRVGIGAHHLEGDIAEVRQAARPMTMFGTSIVDPGSGCRNCRPFQRTLEAEHQHHGVGWGPGDDDADGVEVAPDEAGLGNGHSGRTLLAFCGLARSIDGCRKYDIGSGRQRWRSPRRRAAPSAAPAPVRYGEVFLMISPPGPTKNAGQAERDHAGIDAFADGVNNGLAATSCRVDVN